jgi:hypothetical protein
MGDKDKRIHHLDTVAVSLEAGRTSGHMDLTDGPQAFAFIFGIGPGGLTPFEYQLADRPIGESVTIRVDQLKLAEFFEHIRAPLPRIPDGIETISIRVRVEGAVPADQKDVVKQMAALTGCGDHCCGH